MQVLGSRFQCVTDALRKSAPPSHSVIDYNRHQELHEQLGEIDILIPGMEPVGPRELAAAPKLKLIHQHGRGLDAVDRVEAQKRGIVVANILGGNAESVAEHCLALMLHSARSLEHLRPTILDRGLGLPEGVALRGKTLGIIGLGATGEALARLGQAFGMKIFATKSKPKVLPVGVRCEFVGGPTDLLKVARAADFLSLHIPLTPETAGIIGEEVLDSMKRSAFLINVARGPLVDYDALTEALNCRLIRGAAFDVFWKEPADPADPILKFDNFFMTPHVAGFTDETLAVIARTIWDAVESLEAGRPVLNAVS